MSGHLLSLLVFLPLLGAVVIWLLPARAARGLAELVMLATLAAATSVLVAFDPAGPRFQLLERVLWVASLNVHYQVGVDGLSVLFLPAQRCFSPAAWWPAGTCHPPRFTGEPPWLVISAYSSLSVLPDWPS